MPNPQPNEPSVLCLTEQLRLQPSAQRRIAMATCRDLAFISHIQRAYSNYLGFVPFSRIREALDDHEVLIGTENEQHAGYVFALPCLRSQPFTVPIIQAAVAIDAQRRALGLALLGALEDQSRTDGRLLLQAWVADDVPALDFWAAAGFTRIVSRNPRNARRRLLHLYRKPIHQDGRRLLALLPPLFGARRR